MKCKNTTELYWSILSKRKKMSAGNRRFTASRPPRSPASPLLPVRQRRTLRPSPSARRGGDVELDAADDGHAVHLSRDEIQIGKMPFMRAVRVGGAVVGDRDGLEAHVMCRLHHFGQRAERMVGDVGMCMKIRNDLHFTSVPPVQSVMLPYNLSVICRVHCLSVRQFVSRISRTPARQRAYNRTCGADS